jgi:hypothetical protein
MKVKDVQPRSASNVTDELLEGWKKAYPRGVFKIGVNTDEVAGTEPKPNKHGRLEEVTVYVQKVGYVRKPTRHEIGASMSLQTDPLTQAEDLLNTCWLGGDEELLDDDDYFQGALMQFQELMAIKTGEIKKA